MSGRHILTVYGSPVPQGRPRFARAGNYVRTYDPEKSREWKHSVRFQVVNLLGGHPDIHEGPLSLQLRFYLPRPKSLPKKVAHHVKRPDVDNLAKGCLDAIRKILYDDDAQIVELVVRKEYNSTPRVVIGLEEICPT